MTGRWTTQLCACRVRIPYLLNAATGADGRIHRTTRCDPHRARSAESDAAPLVGARDDLRTRDGDHRNGAGTVGAAQTTRMWMRGGGMSAPKRIQRKRTKGWRMPEGAVYVGRPSKFGNPFHAYKCECCGYWDVRDDNGVTYLVNHEYVRRAHVRADRRTWTTRGDAIIKAVSLFIDEATYWFGGWETTRPDLYAALPTLTGRDLACWCPLDQPCHADVLLELANKART